MSNSNNLDMTDDLDQLLIAAATSLQRNRMNVAAQNTTSSNPILSNSDTILLTDSSNETAIKSVTPALPTALSSIRIDPGIHSSKSTKSGASKQDTIADTKSVTVSEMPKMKPIKEAMPAGLKFTSKEKKKTAPPNAGPGWFGMVATTMTDEVKRDLHIIRSRSALDPKHHYKRDDSTMPRVFQIGTVIAGATDNPSSRPSRRQRSQTIVDTLLSDTETRKYMKTKMKQVFESKSNFTKKRRGGNIKSGKVHKKK